MGYDSIDCILSICMFFRAIAAAAGPIRHETIIGVLGPGAGGLGAEVEK